MAFLASTLNTLSRASLSPRAAQSSASLTRRAVLSHTIATSWAEISAASTIVTRAASQPGSPPLAM
jgi:hypothetical protein